LRPTGIAQLGAEWEQQICAGLSSAEREELLGLLRRAAANIGVGQETLPDRGTGQRPQPVPGGQSGINGD